MISGGFDHQIFVWNPYIDSPVHCLTGHSAPIVSLKFVNNPTHIVSLDQDMNLKVWDSRKFKCNDTMSIDEFEEKKNFSPNGICLLQKPLKLVLFGKGLNFMEYDRHNNLTSADENVSICAEFIPSNLTLLTPVGNKVKVWNLLTGEVKKIFSNLTKSDISTCSLDANSKRFMLGDLDGNLGVYNVNNGALLKSLQRHSSEVISIIHSEKLEVIISASIENEINVHRDHELGESELIRTIDIGNFNISYITFSLDTLKIIVGFSHGLISMFEASTGKGNEDFSDNSLNSGEEISCIEFLHGYSCMVYANAQGRIKFVGAPPLVIKHSKLCEFQNISSIVEDGKEIEKASPVSNLRFCTQTNALFVADEKFTIKCYDISRLLSICSAKLADTMNKSRKDPVVSQDWYRLTWSSHVHDDAIKSMKYIPSESLLISTCMGKQVKIVNSLNGSIIESLKQQKNPQIIKPIAYKKVESDEIYSPRMVHRVDARYMGLFRERQAKEKENKKKLEMGYLPDNDPQAEFEQKLRESKTDLDAFSEYELQEFDPFYYKEKIDKSWADGKQSNLWRLYLNFEKYW